MSDRATEGSAPASVPRPSARGVTRATDWLPHALALLMLVGMATVQIASLRHLHETYDEPRHLLYGQQILAGDATRFDDSKMPVSALNALPGVVALGMSRGPTSRWLAELEAARTVTIAATMALGWLVFTWARRRSGTRAAFLALVLFVCDPNILAHGQLVTTDLYAAGSMTLALFAAWRLLGGGGWPWTVATGLAFGLALISKYTALALAPLLGVSALLVHGPALRGAIRSGGWKALGRPLWSATVRGVVIAVLALAVVNAGFLGDRTGTPLADYAFRSRPFRSMQRRWGVVTRVPVPLPYPYLEGLDWVVHRERTGEGYGRIYLLGETRVARGFPGYYLVASLVKVPLGSLAILCAAGVMYLRRWRSASRLDWVMLAPVAFFSVYFNFFYRAQIGMRYFLVIFPVLYVWAADLLRDGLERRPRARWALGMAIAAIVASVGSYFPHFLPYFNELIGPRTNAYRVLADSNLDWGQHVWYFEQYMAEHPGTIVEPERPTAGHILVGVNVLTGVAGEPERFRWLREHFTPTGHIAHAVLVYDVTPEALARLGLGTVPPGP